jgi:hypothetical protein
VHIRDLTQPSESKMPKASKARSLLAVSGFISGVGIVPGQEL